MSQFTKQQLDDFWWGVGGSETSPAPGAYVLMNQEELLTALTPGQDGFLGNQWDEMLSYIISSRMYGYANYLPQLGHTAGENQGVPNNIPRFGGPMKS